MRSLLRFGGAIRKPCTYVSSQNLRSYRNFIAFWICDYFIPIQRITISKSMCTVTKYSSLFYFGVSLKTKRISQACHKHHTLRTAGLVCYKVQERRYTRRQKAMFYRQYINTALDIHNTQRLNTQHLPFFVFGSCMSPEPCVPCACCCCCCC